MFDPDRRTIPAQPPKAGFAAGPSKLDAIRSVTLSLVYLPLARPISDAKVLTGRQKPLTQVAFLFCEIVSEAGHSGLGFSYSKRAGGPALYAHAYPPSEAGLPPIEPRCQQARLAPIGFIFGCQR